VSSEDQIGPYFGTERRTEAAHSWELQTFEGDGRAEQELAGLVAAKIMAYRCRPKPERFEAWDLQRRGVRMADETTQTALRVIVASGVGLPDRPKSDDHVQSHVAEHLW
jgi:hypothetical protein